MKRTPRKSGFLIKLEQETEQQIEALKQFNLPYDDLLKMAASTMVTASHLAEDNEELTRMCKDYSMALKLFSEDIKDNTYQLNIKVLEMLADARNLAARSLLKGMKLSKKLQAQKGAKERHAETYALRAEVIRHWETHISPSLSADKAAALLSKQFPLSHRKLSEYIAAEKKIRRASKAQSAQA